MKDYRSYSFWLDSAPDALVPRPSLNGDLDTDVVIVGAGYTGLWTAYYLQRADPSLRIVVLEAEIAGFGASGRNGGWCSSLFAAGKKKIARRHGRSAAVALQREMFRTVDEVGRVLAEEGMDAHFHKGGGLSLATSPTHVRRMQEAVDDERSWGLTQQDHRWLERSEAAERIRARGVLGAAYTPHCASLHPARLVRGLADAAERRGTTICERTRVVDLSGRRVVTDAGTVRADVVLVATEGYTARLPGKHRDLLPLYSLMIVTEPLPAAFWEEVGWRGRETFTDGRHLLVYAQRTADDRIALGGRGAPYHYGSRIADGFDRDGRVFDDLQRVLVDLFPESRSAVITHRWGGPLGVPRDWFSGVWFDRRSGLAAAGGYVGDGVSTANLAGRTLADLILERDTEITRLPWVGHRSRRWEPEPFRWIGTNLVLRAMASADRREAATGKPSRRAGVVGRIVGV